MKVWKQIGDVAGRGGGALATAIAWSRGLFGRIGDPVARRQVAFSIALIALSAKMAKADGVVTQSEVAAFRRIFSVPESEQRHVTRLFDLARRDVAGFDAYAARVSALCADSPEVLGDVMDGLFIIAMADGAIHEAELAYLEAVADIFGIRGVAFKRIAVRHVVGPEGDPHLILGVDRSRPLAEIRAQYRKLAAESHPDRFIARGMPEDFLTIVTDRAAAINQAWEEIERFHRRTPEAATAEL
jgi:DnaJ like chaperone protein